MASHTLRCVSMTPKLSMNGCSNFSTIGCIEMITTMTVPVAIEGNYSSNCTREAIAGNFFTDISMLSFMSASSGPNLMGTGCVKVITNRCFSVESILDLPGVDETLYAFRNVVMTAFLTMVCRPNFVDIRGVEMIFHMWVPIAIKSSQPCIHTSQWLESRQMSGQETWFGRV